MFDVLCVHAFFQKQKVSMFGCDENPKEGLTAWAVLVLYQAYTGEQ